MNSAAKTAGVAPALEPMRRTFMIGTGETPGTLAAIEFGDRRRPVEVLFLHANGFNALTYRTVLAPLGRTLHVVAIDQQGHGLSPARVPAEGRTNWLDLRDDLIGVIDSLAEPALTLAGHSMGATVALLAADKRPERIKALALFEPVLFRKPRIGENPLSTRALRRRSVFPDRAAVVAAYRGRGAFASWPEQALIDYVTDGFRDRPDGQVELACSPAWEASNFVAHDHDSLGALRRLGAPTTILRADRGSTCAVQSADEFAADNPRFRIETIPQTSHFLPIERPDLVCETISEMAAT
jgi:pimeloyl-ACP methyl ester carboxylesterase